MIVPKGSQQTISSPQEQIYSEISEERILSAAIDTLREDRKLTFYYVQGSVGLTFADRKNHFYSVRSEVNFLKLFHAALAKNGLPAKSVDDMKEGEKGVKIATSKTYTIRFASRY